MKLARIEVPAISNPLQLHAAVEELGAEGAERDAGCVSVELRYLYELRSEVICLGHSPEYSDLNPLCQRICIRYRAEAVPVIFPPMATFKFPDNTMAGRIERRLVEMGRSAADVSKEATGKSDAIRKIYGKAKDGETFNPRQDTLEGLARVMGRTVSWLIGDAPSAVPDEIVSTDEAAAEVAEIYHELAADPPSQRLLLVQARMLRERVRTQPAPAIPAPEAHGQSEEAPAPPPKT